jgi:drug/metabolite transporter (DMT)-like permease
MIWLLLGVMVASTVLGDVLQSREMKAVGEQTVDARGLLSLLQQIGTRSHLIVAIACMAVSFFAFMALLQRAPVSFAVPASAATLVLETVLARFALGEQVSGTRWFGVLFVFIGVLLLAH